MGKIDFDKTMDLCRAAWEKAQYDNQWKFVVFEPVFVGEEPDYEKIFMHSYNTSFQEEPFLEVFNNGDIIGSEINWSGVELDDLEKKLGFEIESLYDLENEYEIELTEEQKEIIKKFKDEVIENVLDYYWKEGDLGAAKDEYEKIIKEYSKKNNIEIA